MRGLLPVLLRWVLGCFFVSLSLPLCIWQRRIRYGICLRHGLLQRVFFVVFVGHGGLGIHRPSIAESPRCSSIVFLFQGCLRWSSLVISSMRVAYSITDSTPSCLMLSLMLIFLVSPYLVCILAVRLGFIFFIILRCLSWTPFLCRAYMIASRHALSYAFCTSRKIMHAVCHFSCISWMVCLMMMRWSTVAQPLFLPACAFVICCFTLSLIILSYILPTLLGCTFQPAL